VRFEHPYSEHFFRRQTGRCRRRNEPGEERTAAIDANIAARAEVGGFHGFRGVAPATLEEEPERCAQGSFGAGANFEYLPHTADVQLHSWGDSLAEAFKWSAIAMFNYMTPLEYVAVNPEATPAGGLTITAEGHDAQSLLFNWLDECLFVFVGGDLIVLKEIEVVAFEQPGEKGEGRWRIEALGKGERFDRARHQQGTEIKAITYSAMQIIDHSTASSGEGEARVGHACEVFVIVDI